MIQSISSTTICTYISAHPESIEIETMQLENLKSLSTATDNMIYEGRIGSHACLEITGKLLL